MLLKLFLCFFGIFISYLLNGIAVESITTAFGQNIFKFYYLMVLIPALCNLLLAYAVVTINKTSNIKEDLENPVKNVPVPWKYYLFCACMTMGSLLCSNGSLAFINFPTQLILKSSKPIPILLCNCLLPTKKYQSTRYISVGIIVFGVVSFMYEQYSLKQRGKNVEETIQATDNLLFGWFLVFGSLTFDGFLASIQEKMREKFTVNTFIMMFYINFYSCILVAVPTLFSGNLVQFYYFVLANSTVIIYLFVLGFTSAIGQTFIYFTVTHFGPLTCSVITTTRKFFNIFVSFILFSHVVSLQLWLSVFVVFFGLGLDIWIPFANKI